MDLRKLQTFDALKPVTIPQNGLTPKDGVETAAGLGPSFKDTLEQISQPAGMQQVPTTSALKGIEGIKFSNHAVERMKSRGINYSPEDLQRLNQAVAKAAAKGSKDSLVLLNDSALIVSVKNNTVVTVMDKNALKENVFTNIDSTVVL
jgi:flagellar operon protein